MSLLEKNDVVAIAELRSSITFDMILRSEEPNFIDLKREGLRSVVYPVTAITTSFLRSAFPEQAIAAPDIAVALVERNPTWTLLDVINFFKTIISRQDMDEFRVMGNKITLLKMMEMCSGYEMLKAEAHEKLIDEQRGGFLLTEDGKRRESTDQSVKALMGKEFEQIRIKAEQEGRGRLNLPPANENWFKQFKELQDGE